MDELRSETLVMHRKHVNEYVDTITELVGRLQAAETKQYHFDEEAVFEHVFMALGKASYSEFALAMNGIY